MEECLTFFLMKHSHICNYGAGGCYCGCLKSLLCNMFIIKTITSLNFMMIKTMLTSVNNMTTIHQSILPIWFKHHGLAWCTLCVDITFYGPQAIYFFFILLIYCFPEIRQIWLVHLYKNIIPIFPFAFTIPTIGYYLIVIQYNIF